jgi:hypothetical protein
MTGPANTSTGLVCYCCESSLVRAADLPDVRWMRPGDRYCSDCDHVVVREQLLDGWPAARWPCRRHRDVAKGAV